MAKNVKCNSKLKEAVSSFDMFGESVKLTYKGKENFTTTIGTLLSIVILIMLMSFAGYKSLILFTRNNPDVS